MIGINSKLKSFVDRIKKIGLFVLLHFMLMIYSLSGVCSKLASQKDFFSIEFCKCYVGIIVLLLIYAIGWQQIIKILPLSIAYSNKAITIVWGIIWGFFLFGEELSPGKISGALITILGIVLYSFSDDRTLNNE